MKTTLLAAVGLSACVAATAVSQTTLVNIGGWSASGNSYASGVSRDGHTVFGYANTTLPGSERSVRWTAEGGLVAIGGSLPVNYASYFQSYALAANADGSVVAGFDFGSGGTGYRWTVGGGGVSLGREPVGNRPAFPHAVNGSGSAVAGGFNAENQGPLMRWTVSGGLENLGDYPGGYGTRAVAISDDATRMVGVAGTASANPVWKWTDGVGFTMLPPPGGYVQWLALCATPDLAVIGGRFSDQFTGYDRPVVYRSPTNFVVLPLIAGHRFGEVRGMSADGSVVIGWSMSNGLEPSVPSQTWVWSASLGRREISEFLTATGAPTAGWSYLAVSGISGDGRTLVGSGQLGGRWQGWVARLPASQADMGSQGGVEGKDYVLDNNDFVVFISLFFGHDPRADLGVQGGIAGSDGAFDNNDFVVFIDRFFAGFVQ